MFIEFRLPSGPDMGNSGTAWYSALGSIRKQIGEWSQHHDNIPYRDKTIKYFYRVTFDNEHYYTLFAMTFRPGGEQSFWDFKIIQDRNHPE
jgi:hypothetical protein